ncbi:hypothetical protein PAXINDRAFT_19600 [Paxillus involutus ATCC 200175]|uniref:Uncharacterized protein n=1 Tax=Paxillus involutus ATCC 200175 TaxID=664439 RepID=A0A0C9TGU9_PAXIN|nr:hypothetical protein PAXINDRAFT_19600 [Paxillus involutus ATCC 200175]
MAEIPQLRADGRNWTDYHEKILRAAAQQGLDKLYDGTETIQGNAEDWQQRNAIAKSLIVETIPDSILLRILHFKSTHEFFEGLKNLFEQDVATLELLQELRNNRSKREATYGLESANDRQVRKTTSPRTRSEPRPERKREPTSQRRVERRRGVGEEGRVSKGEKDDEKVATASGVSLVNPTSSQGHLPRVRVDTPQPHPTSTSPSPLSHITPILLFEQTAPTSRRPTRQRTQQELEEAARRYLARRKREDGEGSRRGVESRDRGSREAVDEDGEDVHVHHANVEPQQPQTAGQTAVDNEAADTTDPHANSAGPVVPVGTTNGIDEGEKGGEEDEKGEWASGIETPSSNDDGGDEDVRHAYVVPTSTLPPPYHALPPPPDESRPPPSVSLEGEMSGKQSSDHADEAATHLERPPDESTTTPPDEKSSGEGRGTAMSHREAVGGDDEVEGSNDGRDTSNRVNEWRRREDKARDDEERQENREEEVRMGDEAERHNDAADGEVHRDCTAEGVAEFLAGTSIEGEDEHSPRTPPQPPPSSPLSPPSPIPPTSPPYPERRGDDVDTTKSNKTPARRRADAVHDPGGETKKPPSVRLEGESGRRSSLHVETDDVEMEDDDLKTCKTAAQRMCADALHDPGGQTDAPDSVPPSVRIEGERNRLTSLYVEVNHVETDDDHAEDDDHTQPPSRHPVGTTDGDERRPSEPTEPPDEKHGEREVDGELGDKSKVETRRSKKSRRGDEPRGREDEESRSREVEGKEGGQSEGDACQRDGRTNDTGDATSSASCNSSRVETGALAEHEDGQHRDGIRNASMNVPGPPSPLPYAMPRPTHIANPPRRRGRLKSPPTKVSRTRAYGLRTKSDGHADHLPVQLDATETVRSYRGSVPKPPQSRTKGTEARTSTPPSIPANYHIG